MLATKAVLHMYLRKIVSFSSAAKQLVCGMHWHLLSKAGGLLHLPAAACTYPMQDFHCANLVLTGDDSPLGPEEPAARPSWECWSGSL